ncbi:SGNH/GDSL hydrolase family protein [Streptomyces sp. NPDC001002]
MPTNRLTVIGDSFVEGWGDPAADGGFHGWAARLADLLDLPPGSVRNLGQYGSTTQRVVNRQLPRALAGKAPIIGVVVGVNDLLGDYDARRYRRNMRTILESLAGADTTVLTANYPDFLRDQPSPAVSHQAMYDRFEEGNAVVEELAASTGAILVDVRRPRKWREAAMWADDNLHPGPLGHQVFAEDAAAGLLAGTVGVVAA